MLALLYANCGGEESMLSRKNRRIVLINAVALLPFSSDQPMLLSNLNTYLYIICSIIVLVVVFIMILLLF